MKDVRNMEIESAAAGKPHQGKVLAAIFPHCDDFSIFAGGTIAKLLAEGYVGYLIRTTNDEMDSWDLSVGETILAIERETQEMAQVLGIRKVYDLNYKNHYLDQALVVEMRHRLIALFRFLKVDTVLSFDPWGHYEENPDHYFTAMAVVQACWMAGRRLDLPELADMGLEPHYVDEKYYCARGPQLANRVVDISSVIGTKLRAIETNRTPMNNMLNAHRQKGGKVGSVDEMARGHFIDSVDSGFPGFIHGEVFHYIGPEV